MKHRRHQLTLYALVLLALNIIYWKKPQSARPSEANGGFQAAIAEAPITEEKPQLMKLAESAPPAEAASSEAVTPPEENTIASVVNAIDPMKSADFIRAIEELRRLPSEQVSAFFVQNLKDIGTDRSFERDRLVMLANSMQLKTDLPFWEDLVRRQTPRYAHEENLRNPKHPTLESRFIDMEQLQAIRNIGLLARDSRQARKVLMEIILTPDPSAHRTLHREEAYTALKETDLAASLRVLKQLPAEDELWKRL